MNHQTNIVRIKAVYNSLGELQDKVVFVGGATVSLYADRPTLEIRPTDDVDIIVEIINYSGRTLLEEKLRYKGFQNDIESGIACRYKIEGIVVDVMPTNEPSIGFLNKWYPEGFRQAIDFTIDQDHIVKILSAPYFIATKLEAFKGRGKNDGRTSHDFEDIIYVLENRTSIWEELTNADIEVKKYLRNKFSQLLKNKNVFEWIDCHVERGSPPATYWIIEELMKFSS